MENKNLSSGNGLSKRNFILFTVAIFFTYAIFGMVDTIRGTVLPRIQDEFLLTELHLGIILAVNSAGYLLACTFTASISAKTGIKAAHIVGLLVIAGSGVAIFFAPNFPLLLLAFFVMNFGFGMLEIAVGVIAAKIFTKNTGTMMSIAHFFYGGGSIVSPIIATSIMMARFADQITGWRFVYLIALNLALIPIIPALIGKLRKKGDSKKSPERLSLIRRPSIWLVIMILLFALIAEGGIVSWFVTFLESAHDFSSERAALFLTLYFVVFTLTRLVIGPILDRMGFLNTLAVVTAFSGVVITAGVLLGARGAVLIIFSGIGISPVFPTIMAIIAKMYSDTIELAMTTIMTVIGIFMIPMNFLVGGIINQARVVFTYYHGDAGIPMAFSAGFLVFGVSLLLSSTFTLILRHRQIRSGKLI